MIGPAQRGYLAAVVLLGLIGLAPAATWAQGDLPDGPKPRETFEDDADKDGIPDGWYNLRDAVVVDHGYGGGAKAKCLRFSNARPGRPARASRAFGLDGRQVEAVIVGAWVRAEDIVAGERLGDEPGLVVDFLGDPIQLKAVRRGSLGPWKTIGREWTHVRKRLPIPPETRLAILSMGLIGATGVLEVDDLTIELVPTGGEATTNLVGNGDFELGDPDATGWTMDRGAHRVSPGPESPAAVELRGQGARAYTGLAVPVDHIPSLEVAVKARANGLRGAVGAAALVFFLDDDGRPLPRMQEGVVAIPFAGSFPWGPYQGQVDVPPGARRALIHFEKSSNYGTLTIDDVRVTAKGGGEVSRTPYHVATNTNGWAPVAPSPEIRAGSALDASALLDAPAGKEGFVVVRDGRLAFERGGRARFFGVSLLPPTAFLEADRADALLDRLARSGVNLIRLAELETPLGPARSLPDDTRDDTRAIDPNALARLDHLVAGAIRRGIYVALELQGARRLREGDAVPDGRKLPPGGGPAAAFDADLRALVLANATELLNHVNPETGRAWKDEPGLAWVTLAGELTLFDRPEVAAREPKGTDDAIRSLMRRAEVPSTPRGWSTVEGNQWAGLAGDLRKAGLRVPVAGGSHFRRDPADYNAAQAAAGLDLIDDRLYFNPAAWADPDRRALTWSRENPLVALANRKRRADRPYVVGQFADPTYGAWATPYEGVDLLFAAVTAANEDWDALVRRGVFLFPQVWGAAAAGTGGGEDIFGLGEAINGIPQAFALLPHSASVVRHATGGATGRAGRPAPNPGGGGRSTSGFDPRTNRLVIDTPHTRGVAAWGLARSVGAWKSEGLTIDVADPSGLVVVSSLDREPIATSRRLLVTALGRVEPTDYRSVDEWRRESGDPGRPPLLHEGVRARVTWQHPGRVLAFALDNTGARVGPARVEPGDDGGTRLEIDGRTPSLHWELVVE